MWLSRLLPKRSPSRGSKPRAGHRLTTRFRPHLEELEDRWLPSQLGLTVTSLADSGAGTLRTAILTADAGSHSDMFTIGFSVSGTINLNSPLPDLNNNITIQGQGAASLTVEETPGLYFNDPIFNVGFGGEANPPSVSISGMALANSAAGIVNAGNLTVANCVISNNHLPAGYGGAGIYNVSGKLTITGCNISGNSSGGGGGIYVNEGTVTVSGSTISGNSSTYGGGIENIYGSVAVSGTTISGNSATYGGGIYNQAGGTLKVNNNSTLSGNSALDGGGIDNLGTAAVQNSTLSGNTATEGGGIYNAAFGTLTVQGSTLTGNTAGDSGGGLYNLGTVSIQESTLSGNTAGYAGGGTFNGASGTLAVKDSTALNNVAPLGADLYNLGALTLDDSTVGVMGP
jgi:hypothetical protein